MTSLTILRLIIGSIGLAVVHLGTAEVPDPSIGISFVVVGAIIFLTAAFLMKSLQVVEVKTTTIENLIRMRGSK